MEYFCCVLRRHLIKKLKTLTQMHCSTLFLVGSQFIFKNSFVPTWALLFEVQTIPNALILGYLYPL